MHLMKFLMNLPFFEEKANSSKTDPRLTLGSGICSSAGMNNGGSGRRAQCHQVVLDVYDGRLENDSHFILQELRGLLDVSSPKLLPSRLILWESLLMRQQQNQLMNVDPPLTSKLYDLL